MNFFLFSYFIAKRGQNKQKNHMSNTRSETKKSHMSNTRSETKNHIYVKHAV